MSIQVSRAPSGDGSASRSLQEIVKQASALLPIQAPIHAFVHQNILAAFEDLPFEDAMRKASRTFGSNAFPTEKTFARFRDAGRIQKDDIDAILRARLAHGTQPIWPNGPTRHAFRSARVQSFLEIASRSTVEWKLAETDLLDAFCEGLSQERLAELTTQVERTKGRGRTHDFLKAIWSALYDAAPTVADDHALHRRRDQILEDIDIDTDTWVHPLMIRLTGAFLDQGICFWPMPDRELGFLRAVRKLYSASIAPPDRHFTGLATVLRQHENAGLDAEATIRWALDALGHDDPECWPDIIQATLLALPGWGGMMNQLEIAPAKAPVKASPTSLMDFLAIRLVLDAVVARNVSGGRGDRAFRFKPIDKHSRAANDTRNLAAVYEAFVLAQRLDINASALLEPNNARAWINEVIEFDSTGRCELLMLAFERRYRNGVLDTLMANATTVRQAPETKIQMVFCIDDREESYRRHVEETDPSVETFSYPGFFGVAMNFQGATDIRPRPLCPVVIKPTHAVHEEAISTGMTILGRLIHQYHVGRATLLRGAMFSLLGTIATIPLALLVLFPRLASYRKPKPRRSDPALKYRFDPTAPARADGLPTGYKPEEMAQVVAKMLIETGLRHRMTPLVLLMGHGSTSVNNPHIAGYGCGATGGGHGGPNARVIAAMANEPETRALLAQQGIHIPTGTWFVGCQHNTCTDDVVFYDQDKIPGDLQGALTAAADILIRASQEHAHERSRLFATLPDKLEPTQAKKFVEGRSVDLSEARPEYDHSKNSLCIVASRKWTRGIMLDKRSFLVSYDGSQDHDGRHLIDTLSASVPVCAGINLSYLLSLTDNIHYGSGTKLPHNITGLLGVMDGHASGLRTGLYHQMIEIHEPLRLLLIVETTPEALTEAMTKRPGIDRLIRNRWIQACAWIPARGQMFVFEGDTFRPYTPEQTSLASANRSRDIYVGTRVPLPCIRIESTFRQSAS